MREHLFQRILCPLLVTGAISLQATGQSASPATAPLAFEVASIKATERPNVREMMAGGGMVRMGMRIDASRVEIGYMTLATLVSTAYRLKAYQVSGPDWIKMQGYSVSAKIPAGASRDQVPEMLQTLLADRFKLTIHREKKEQSVFALVVGKDGLKLKETTPDPEPSEGNGGTNGEGGGQAMTFRSGGRGGGTSFGGASNGMMHIDRKMTLAQLGTLLSTFVDRPILDMTDAKATYQVTIDIPIAAMFQAGRANIVMNGESVSGGQNSEAMQSAIDKLSDESGGATIFTAVQKIGLKLEPRKASVDFVVVDHAEKSPTEN